MSEPQVLFVDDEDDIRISATQALELAGFYVRSFSAADKMLGEVSSELTGAIVTDIRMPGLDGMSFMQRVHEIDPDIPVILITGHGDVQLAVRAMRDGAYDFIEKPFASAHLAEVVRRALDRRALVVENRQLRSAVSDGDDLDRRLAGRSAAVTELREQVRTAADSDADILLVGPAGTGKQATARALHDISARKNKPFVVVNCAALNPATAASELFGHEVGAFAGALRARVGRLEHGRGGTIYLQEVAALEDEVQAQLLQVLDERAVRRVGGGEAVDLDARIVFGMPHDLDQQSAQGQLRKDLFYRLDKVRIVLPQLADRREDIPGLFSQFMVEAASRFRKQVPEVSGQVLSALAARDWPGNVRELRNWAERMVLGLDKDQLENPVSGSARLADRVAAFEKSVLVAELEAAGGSLRTVYQRLGLSRKTLYEKMQRHGLRREDFSR